MRPSTGLVSLFAGLAFACASAGPKYDFLKDDIFTQARATPPPHTATFEGTVVGFNFAAHRGEENLALYLQTEDGIRIGVCGKSGAYATLGAESLPGTIMSLPSTPVAVAKGVQLYGCCPGQ